MKWKHVITFFFGGVVGFLLSQGVQSMLDAGAASKMKRSIANGMSLSAALEKFRTDNGRYPSVFGLTQLDQSLTPKYLRAVPTDVYGRPYVIAMNGTTAAVISLGRGGFVVQKEKLIECVPYTTEGCR